MVDESLATATSTTLLDRLRDPANQAVWDEYVLRYRPAIVRTVRRAGLPESDAEDVAQTVLLEFASAYRRGGYDREKGRLRAWLFGIVRNQIRRWNERVRGPALAIESASALEGEIAPDEISSLWEEEWRAAILRRCFEIVRSEVEGRTLEAFRRFAVEGESAESVAEALGLSANAVFLAKRRVLARMRELQPMLEDGG